MMSLPGLNPEPAACLQTLYDALWDAGVDRDTLELCRLRIATLVGSEPDPPPALAAGVVAALPSWPTAATFSAAQRVALGFAEQYVLDPHGVTDEQAADLRAHFSPPELATLTTAIAVFDALARVRAIITHVDD